jgi:hypothetical protein
MDKQIAQDEIPLSNWDIVQTLAGFLFFVALLYSWLFTPSFVNRIVIYLDRDNYKPAIFIVTDADFDSGFETGPDWCLTGDIGGFEERFVPKLSKGLRPRSADELLQHFPKGTQFDVLYNPAAHDILSQGESLRVLEARPNLWQLEAQSAVRLGKRVLLPVPVTFAFYMIVRLANQRRRQMQLNRTG